MGATRRIRLNERADRGIATDITSFIFGLPRSGTTLTEQFLATRPMVYAAGELQLGSGSFAPAQELAEAKTAIHNGFRDSLAGRVMTVHD